MKKSAVALGKPAVGYLVSEYPARSHTFIRREIEALTGVGVDVKTYSVRPPKYEVCDAKGLRAVADTFYILKEPVIKIALSNLRALITQPKRFLSTLALAIGHRVPGLRAGVWAMFHFAEAVVLAERMRSDGVVRLHNHFANAGATVGLLAAHFNNIPWSVTLHGISEFDYPAGNLLPEKLKRAEFAACVSYFGMAQAMRMIDSSLWGKLHLVRCAINLDEISVGRRKVGRPVRTFICVGRLSPEKGHLGLIWALSGLRNRGIYAELVLVGDGPQRELLEGEARSLGLTECIRFRGALSETATLRAISEADAFVLPSFMEGLPIVLMEALALQVPVIASRVAGIPELIVHERTGLLFDPANWEDLEEKMVRLVIDDQLRSSLERPGYEIIEQCFSYPSAALPLAELLSRSSVNEEPSSTIIIDVARY